MFGKVLKKKKENMRSKIFAISSQVLVCSPEGAA